MNEATLIIDKMMHSAEFLALNKEVLNFKKTFLTTSYLAIINSILKENAYSDILSYLLDSSNDHNLKTKMVKCWLHHLRDSTEVEKMLKKLNEIENQITASSREVHCDKGGRIDIVVEIKDLGGNILAVFGIENKLPWRKEDEDQLKYYQEFLTICYPGIPKVIFFLNLEGEESVTADYKNMECPCVSISFMDVISILKKLPSPPLNTPVSTLIKDLENNYTKFLGAYEKMDEINQKIDELFRRQEYRSTLRAIAEYKPRMNIIYKKIRSRLLSDLINKYSSEKFEISCRPKEKDKKEITEVKVKPETFNKIDTRFFREKNLQLIFLMKKEKKDNPISEDTWTFYTGVYASKFPGKNLKETQKFKNEFRTIMGLDYKLKDKDWKNWIVLTEGIKCEINDYDQKDIKTFTDKMLNGIERAYPEIKNKISKNIKKLSNIFDR